MKCMMKSLVLPLTVTAVLTSHAGAAQSAQTNAASAPKANTQTSDLFGNSVLAKGKGVTEEELAEMVEIVGLALQGNSYATFYGQEVDPALKG